MIFQTGVTSEKIESHPMKLWAKFRYCEKATKFEKNLPPSFEIT